MDLYKRMKQFIKIVSPESRDKQPEQQWKLNFDALFEFFRTILVKNHDVVWDIGNFSFFLFLFFQD